MQPCVPLSLHPLGIGFLAEVALHVRTSRGPRHSGAFKVFRLSAWNCINCTAAESSFCGGMCVLNVTHNPATPSLRMMRTRCLQPAKGCSQWPWCHLVAMWGSSPWSPGAGGGLERSRGGKFTSRTAEAFLYCIFVTTSIPQEFFDTPSVVGVSFKPEGWGRAFISGIFLDLPRHFQGRHTCCRWCLNSWLTVGTLCCSPCHKPWWQAQ